MAKPLTSSTLVNNSAYSVVNYAFAETIGKPVSGHETLDSQGLVDMGRTLAELDLYDGFYGKLTNKIVKTIAYVMTYKANGRQILSDAISYGSFIEKVYVDSIDAVANPVYSVTQSNGTMSNIAKPFDITQTFTIDTKLFGMSDTWAYEFNDTTLQQIRSAFLNESSMIAFVDSLFAKAQADIELQKEAMVNLAFNTGVFIASRGNCVYNLRQRYNTKFSQILTKDSCKYDATFLKWANMEINRIVSLLAKPSKQFTPSHYLNRSDRSNLVLECLKEFADCSKVFLESGTYHDDKVALSGNYEEVPFWQTNSDDFEIASSINIKNADVWKISSTAEPFITDGIIAVARDKEYCKALFEEEYQWSMPNPRARLNSYGFDFRRGYAVEPHAVCVVFTIGDYVTPTITQGSTVSASGDWIVGNTVIYTVSTANASDTVTCAYTYKGDSVSLSAEADGTFKLPVRDGISAVTFTVTQAGS